MLLAFIVLNIFPVKINFANGPIILLLVLSLYGMIKNFRIKHLNHFLFILSIPLMVYSLGMINTENLEYGTKFIMRNIYFLVFPFILYNQAKESINSDLIYKFYLGALAVVNLYLIYLFIYYFNLGERFYKIVTFDIYHSTYLGLYNLFGFWIVLIKKELVPKTRLRILLLVFFIACAIMTSSRIIFILSILSLISSALLNYKLKLKFLISMIAILVLTMIFILVIPSINEKFMQILELKSFSFNKDNYLSVSSRLAKLEAANTIIKNNLFFGTGTGDLMDELVKVYKDMKFTMGYKYRYNPHNQFLDNISRNGIILGSLALASIYVWPLILSFKRRSYLLGALVLLMIGVSMTESILNVQRGISFCAFFLTILVFDVYSKSDSKIG